MPAGSNPPLTDDALDRLARGWFADARARTREDEQASRRSRPTARTDGDATDGLLDWVFGSDGADDDSAC